MEMMRHLANDLVEEKIGGAFGSSGGTPPLASSVADATDKEMEEELDRKMRWLKGEPFLERLKLLKKDTIRCNRALRETVAFVSVTVDEAINDCREYEKALAERAIRIRQCKQRMNQPGQKGQRIPACLQSAERKFAHCGRSPNKFGIACLEYELRRRIPLPAIGNRMIAADGV